MNFLPQPSVLSMEFSMMPWNALRTQNFSKVYGISMSSKISVILQTPGRDTERERILSFVGLGWADFSNQAHQSWVGLHLEKTNGSFFFLQRKMEIKYTLWFDFYLAWSINFPLTKFLSSSRDFYISNSKWTN